MMKSDHLDPKEPVNSKQWRKLCSRSIVDWEIEEMLEIKLVEIGGDQEICGSEVWRHAFDINEPIYIELCHAIYSTYEFNERLGLYFNEEVREERFEIYFHGGLRSDGHFNAREYWLSISIEKDQHLSRSHASTTRKPILRAKNQDVHANVAWVIVKWMKKKRAGSCKESMICCDRITIRDLIGPNGRLITKAPMLGAPRVAMHVSP
nr:hypothetical protein [Tanacetum cinerariifolium]